MPPWAAKVIAVQLIAVLTMIAIGLVMLLPYLPRLAAAGSALPEITESAERSPTTLDQVERIDDNVERVVPPVLEAVAVLPEVGDQLEQLLGVARSLGSAADGVVAAAEPLAAVGTDIRALRARLDGLETQLGRLEALGEPLDSLATSARPLPGQLEQLTAAATAIASIAEVLDQLVGSIGRMEQHVANLDQKTGPVLLPDLTGTR
jgi:ABC-type transporter Mla subunit MlaD